MVDTAATSNGFELIDPIDTETDPDESKQKHLFSTEIFERDELWNDFSIVQQVDANSSNKASSGVWKYFGKLHYDNQIVDEGYFYCIECYENRVTKKYQTNTSTGNLIKHMIRAHDTLLQPPMYRIKRENDSHTIIKEERKGEWLANAVNDCDVVYGGWSLIHCKEFCDLIIRSLQTLIKYSSLKCKLVRNCTIRGCAAKTSTAFDRIYGCKCTTH